MTPDADCRHDRIVGDNYKEECLVCGKVEWNE